MIKTDELRGIIAKNNQSQASVAKALGMTPKTFYNKMKKGVLGSDEIESMIYLLKINNPSEFFQKCNLRSYKLIERLREWQDLEKEFSQLAANGRKRYKKTVQTVTNAESKYQSLKI